MGLLQKDFCQDCWIQCLWPQWGQCWHTPQLETPEQSQACLSQSLVGSLLLSSGSWYAQDFFFVPSKSLFPQSCGSSVIKSHWPSESNSVPLPDPQVGKSFVGPSTFATVQELLWYNCSPVCGLSSWWLYGGAHTHHLPGLLQPEAPSPWQVVVELCLRRRHSNIQSQVSFSFLWGLWVLVHTKFCLSPPSISGGYEVWI